MLLPDPKRRGEVQFVFAKALRYETRLGIILSLLAAGFLLQYFVNVWVGIAPLLAGSLLGIVRGFNNIPESGRKRYEWRGAEKAQLENVLKLARRARKWDQSMLDVTCATGLFLFLFFFGAIAAGGIYLWNSGSEWLALLLVVDSVVLMLPHWITGIRRVLTNAPLTIKVGQLLAVYQSWEEQRQEGETMLAQLEVAVGKEGEMPHDAKLVLQMAKLGDAFLGLQVQVVINSVQGSDYPYLYCVLVARPELGMLSKLDPRPPGKILAEANREGDAEILVVRNQTTKTGGYHTRPQRSLAIFGFALEEARRLAALQVAG